LVSCAWFPELGFLSLAGLAGLGGFDWLGWGNRRGLAVGTFTCELAAGRGLGETAGWGVAVVLAL